MKRRKMDWREELENYQIHTKSGRLKFVVDVIKAYEITYPVRFRFYLNQFKKLKQVMKADGYTDKKGRKVWSDNIPTEPFLFVQRWIPKFGTDPDWPDDMNMLKRAWEDFICSPKRKHLKHTVFWKGSKVVTPQESPKPEKETVFPEEEVQLVDDQGRPLGSSGADQDDNGQGEPTEHPTVSDDDHEERPRWPEEVSGDGEVSTPD